MTSRNGRELVSAEIPVELKEAVDMDDRAQWEVITEALQLYLGMDEGETISALERQVGLLEERNAVLEDEIASRKEEKEENEEQIAGIRDKIEELQAERESYSKILNRILGEMSKNPQTNIKAYRSDLKEAAKIEYGHANENTFEEVIDDIEQLIETEDYSIRQERLNGSGNGDAKKMTFKRELKTTNGGAVNGE